MYVDRLQKNIINQLVAVDDGRVMHNPLEPYFRAFTGAFCTDMPFTFYFEARNQPLLFVYDPTPIAARTGRAVFAEHCEKIKAQTLLITDYVQELADSGYLTVDAPWGRPPLPPDYGNYWRKHKQFFPNLIGVLYAYN
jgi:hypothetical protein